MANAVNTVDVAFVKEYDAQVHHAYQRRGSKLLGAVRRKTNVRASTVRFQKIGKGTAGSKDRNGDVPIMNPLHEYVDVTLVDKYAGQYIDNLDEIKTNIREREIVADEGAWAVGRVTDDQIIEQLDATTNDSQITGASAMSKTRAQLATQTLDDNDCPDDGMRFGLVAPKQWYQLMNITEFSSKDFVESPIFPTGGRAFIEWLGVKWLKHTALTGVGKWFMWHANAIGHASGMDVTSVINYVPQKDSHLAMSKMSMGAILIDANGVIEAACD